MERLGLGYETLAARNPGLVYCASVGYGQDGPYVGRPGQDLLVQSLAGLASLGGRDQDPPAPAGIGVADLAAGLHIVYGVLAALIARSRSGRGQRVDVNMLNALLALEHQEIASYLYTGALSPRSSSGIASPYAGAPWGSIRPPTAGSRCRCSRLAGWPSCWASRTSPGSTRRTSSTTATR